MLPAAATPEAAAQQGPAAPVLVAIVVDQMAAWIANDRWGLLPAHGAFARLMREGTLVRQLRYAHACTDTATGHAALFTGATPRVSGIFGNEWIDESGTPVSMIGDPAESLLTAKGLQGPPAASLRSLQVETLADRLRATHPQATIVSLSLKDRGAVFGGGRRPDLSLWYDRTRGTFATSTAFAEHWPAWLPRLASEPLARAEAWNLLDAAFVQSHAATADAAPGEGDLLGFGVTFPHPMPRPSDLPSVFRILPQGDEVLLDLALAAVDRHLGTKGRVEALLLAISLSTNDYIGHVFGPDSFEAWDQLRRLDEALARFFAGLDERLGPEGWAAMLSGDHGVATLPEALATQQVAAACARESTTAPRRSCAPGERLSSEALHQIVAEAARAALGRGEWIAGVSDPYVFYSRAAEALTPERRSALDTAVVAALAEHPAIERALPSSSIPRDCPRDPEALDALICEAFWPGGPGDVYFVLGPGSFVDPGLTPGKGSSHGTPYDYDRAVPLVVRAPQRVAAGVRIDAPVGFRAFARTAASLLGIEPPDAARDGLDLTSPAAPEVRPS